MRKIIVTSGLVYANGDLHLGHILEQIQADIWVRFQKLIGNQCFYLSGDDTHGTPIMLSAQKLGITAEALIEQMYHNHKVDSEGLLIQFDAYHSTHSSANLTLTQEFYQKLLHNQNLVKKEIEQAYDDEAKMFLPDRFVKGGCPKCHALGQYGDNCEKCGASYTPRELLDPISTLSGRTPVFKKTEHLFFRLSLHQTQLQSWLPQAVTPEIKNKLSEWFTTSLQDWDISRDPPYFGFAIPGETDKFFYVWFDAPIGYIAAFQQLAEQINLDFQEFWAPDSNTELYHFIGKDIIYFHGLFWPAMLQGAQLRKPSALFTHGFLTVNGEKMSKSRGTFILVKDYLRTLEPEYLRYYLANKLNASIEDIDLNLEDFIQRNNSDLIGKVVNIASRLTPFINQHFDQYLSSFELDQSLWQQSLALAPAIQRAYEERNFSQAIRHILNLADAVNQYIDQHKPWAMAKVDSQNPEIQKISTLGLNLYRQIILFLKPILPLLAQKSEKLLNISPMAWEDLANPLHHHRINLFTPLMQRVDAQKVKTLLA